MNMFKLDMFLVRKNVRSEIILNFSEFWRQYSYRLYSYKRKICINKLESKNINWHLKIAGPGKSKIANKLLSQFMVPSRAKEQDQCREYP